MKTILDKILVTCNHFNTIFIITLQTSDLLYIYLYVHSKTDTKILY